MACSFPSNDLISFYRPKILEKQGLECSFAPVGMIKTGSFSRPRCTLKDHGSSVIDSKGIVMTVFTRVMTVLDTGVLESGVSGVGSKRGSGCAVLERWKTIKGRMNSHGAELDDVG